MSTRRRSTSALSLLSFVGAFVGAFAVSACAAFYVPNEDDDTVQRCNSGEDCEDLDDNRYVAVCVYGEDQPENSSKVCAADFEQVKCGDMDYAETHPMRIAINDAIDNKAAYGQCSEENRGKRGCAPRPQDSEDPLCDEGLTISNDAGGICDDPDDPIPAVYPPEVGGPDIAGQDAKDQFCRWHFCDETFVCAKSGSREVCQPCSGTDPADYGGGACGQLYVQGEPSSIYTSLDEANCNGDRAITEEPYSEDAFGPAPTPAP
jgi:hypothetical protein